MSFDDVVKNYFSALSSIKDVVELEDLLRASLRAAASRRIDEIVRQQFKLPVMKEGDEEC